MSSTTELSGWERLRQRLELPVFTKEIRARMHGKRARLTLYIVLIVTVIVAFIALGGLLFSVIHAAELFTILSLLQGILVTIMAPAFAAGGIAMEREQQTLETLFLTRLSSRNILFGKWLSAFSVSVLIVLCGLPVIIIVLFFGVTLERCLWTVLCLLTGGALFSMIGLFCSTVFRKPATAIVVAYIISVLLLALPSFLCMQIANDDLFTQNDMIAQVLRMIALPMIVVAAVILLNASATRLRGLNASYLTAWGLLCICGILVVTLLAPSSWTYLFAAFGLAIIYAAILVGIGYAIFTSVAGSPFAWLPFLLCWSVTTLYCDAILLTLHTKLHEAENPMLILLSGLGAPAYLLNTDAAEFPFANSVLLMISLILPVLSTWMLFIYAQQQLDKQRRCGRPQPAEEVS